MALALTPDTKDSLFNRHINPFFIWRFGIPEEEIDGSICRKPVEVEKAAIKISLEGTVEVLHDYLCIFFICGYP